MITSPRIDLMPLAEASLESMKRSSFCVIIL